MTKEPQIIGSVVKLSIPAGGIYDLPTKIDTGADGSSIWATNIIEKENEISFCLLGPSSDKYTGIVLRTADYRRVRIKNSFGDTEIRYRAKISVVVEGRRVSAKFSLANRESKSYPALIGRRLLNKRFVVDISKSHKPKH
jgi:hypothetical protein